MNKKVIRYITIGLVFLSSIATIYVVANIKQVKILNTSPASNETGVAENKIVMFVFNTNISTRSKENISVKATPSFGFDSSWNNNTYIIAPINTLQNGTKYTIDLYLKNKIVYSLSFETSPVNQDELLKNTDTQTKDDLLYGKALTNLDMKYPFYKNLPIKNSNYVVYYDFEQDMFAITFIREINTSSEKDKLINEAVDAIKKIGGKEPIKYYTSP